MIPRIQPLAGVSDYLGLQDDLTMLALSHAPLRQVNVTQERKFLMDAALQIDALWQTPRNGGAGAGIIIEDIRTVVAANSDGQLYDLLCGFVIFGERNISMGPAGCGMHPEQIESLVAGLFNLKLIEPYGLLRASGNVGEPAGDWIDSDAGIYARRVSLRILNGWKQPANCDPVFITITAGTVQITCNSPAAELQIWFTTDGSCPSNDGEVNPNAHLYAAPFTAASGTVIRAVAFAPGVNPSALKQKIVP